MNADGTIHHCNNCQWLLIKWQPLYCCVRSESSRGIGYMWQLLVVVESCECFSVILILWEHDIFFVFTCLLGCIIPGTGLCPYYWDMERERERERERLCLIVCVSTHTHMCDDFRLCVCDGFTLVCECVCVWWFYFFFFFLLSHHLCRPQRHCSRAARPGIPHLRPHPTLIPHRGPAPRGPQEVTSDRW